MGPVRVVHVAVTLAITGDVPTVRSTFALPVASVTADDGDRVPASVAKVIVTPCMGFPFLVAVALIVDFVAELTTSWVGEADCDRVFCYEHGCLGYCV